MSLAENEDLRVRRTRKMLQEALLELTVEKGFAAVTVRDICERAMVNRSTFYRHYLDKYALLEQYIDEVQALVSEKAFMAEKTQQSRPEVPGGLVVLLRHIQEFADFYRVMLGAEGDAKFIQLFRRFSENRFRMLLSNQTPDPNAPPIDLRLSYISCAGIGAILWWLENGQQWTAEELAIWMGQISMTSAGLTPTHVPTAKSILE